MRLAVLLLSLESLVALPAAANGPGPAPPELQPYRLVYTASYNGMPIEAVRELTASDTGYRIESRARNFLGKIVEIESFTMDDEGRLHPLSYSYDRSILGIKRDESLRVDREAGIATYERKGETRNIPLEDDLLGPVSYQEQLRQDLIRQEPALSYRVLVRGKINEYEFERLGEEQLDTGMGRIETLKVRRIREADNPRETILWLAINDDFRLVKLLQVEEDGEKYEMLIKESSAIAEKTLPEQKDTDNGVHRRVEALAGTGPNPYHTSAAD